MDLDLCPDCGENLARDQTYCLRCGARVDPGSMRTRAPVRGYEPPVRTGPDRPPTTGEKRAFAVISVVVVAVVVLAVTVPIAAFYPWGGGDGGESGEDGAEDTLVLTSTTYDYFGTASENTAVEEVAEVDFGSIEFVTVTLSWTDESPSSIGGINEPDEMGYRLRSPTGEEFFENFTTAGAIQNTYCLNGSANPWTNTGNWELMILCGDCGDDTHSFGLRTVEDTACTYSCEVTFHHYVKESGS